MSSITLRYFDCRGRAQPLRHYLAERGVSFLDERVPFDDGYLAWARLKNDPAASGPFGMLPVLLWEGRLHAETALIASFLQRKLDPSQRARSIAEAQSALSDDLMTLHELLNLDRVAPGADARFVASRVETRLIDSFGRYDALAAGPENPFVLPTGFSVAAFWLHEVWQLTQFLLGMRARAIGETLSSLGPLLRDLAALPVVTHGRIFYIYTKSCTIFKIIFYGFL